MARGDLHLSVNSEGVVRVLNMETQDAVLIVKEALEELLTEVYGMALLDRKESRETRLR